MSLIIVLVRQLMEFKDEDNGFLFRVLYGYNTMRAISLEYGFVITSLVSMDFLAFATLNSTLYEISTMGDEPMLGRT